MSKKSVKANKQVEGFGVKEIDQENWITEVDQNASNSLLCKQPKESRR